MDDQEMGSGCAALLFLGMALSSGLPFGLLLGAAIIFFGLIGVAQDPAAASMEPEEYLQMAAWVLLIGIIVGVIFS